MIVYLLAIASPTHPVPASTYYSGWASQSDEAVQYRRGWSRTTVEDDFANGHEYYGHKSISAGRARICSSRNFRFWVSIRVTSGIDIRTTLKIIARSR